MLRFDAKQMERINKALDLLAAQPSPGLLNAIGGAVLGQTRQRIASEKRDPAGRPWAQWSDEYAETRSAGQRLLEGTGSLLESIQMQIEGLSVSVGSDLVYASSQQFSEPEREFLGLSDQNERDLLFAMGRHLEREIARV
jgi:phage gpG-like protein